MYAGVRRIHFSITGAAALAGTRLAAMFVILAAAAGVDKQTADSTEQYDYQRRDASWNFTWEVGGMVNTSTQTALGATLLLGVD